MRAIGGQWLDTIASWRGPISRAPRLALYAGQGGWKNTEYSELLASAREALGEAAVISGVAPRGGRLLHCCFFLLRHRPTHFFYDPRWGSRKPFTAALEGRVLGALLHLIGSVPVSLLNNLPEVTWRQKIALVNRKRGLCIALTDPTIAQPVAPELRNLVGPIPMALSSRTLKDLKQKWRPYPKVTKLSEVTISFVGSLYEPRTSLLLEARRRLGRRGVKLEIVGRNLSDPKIDENTYFKLLQQSPFTFTTADQAFTSPEQGFPVHLVYRYIEAIAAGTLLIAPAVPGAERYFAPNVHFLECPTIDYLSDKIPDILLDSEKTEWIRENGRSRVEEMVEGGFFWTRINEELIAHDLERLFS